MLGLSKCCNISIDMLSITPVLVGPEPPNPADEKSDVLVSNYGVSDATPAVASLGQRRIYSPIPDTCKFLLWPVNYFEILSWNSSAMVLHIVLGIKSC